MRCVVIGMCMVVRFLQLQSVQCKVRQSLFLPLALHSPHRPPRSSRLEHVHVPFLPLCFGAFPHKVDAADLIEPFGDIGLLELRHIRVERRARDQRPRRFLGGSVDCSIHVVVACEVERAEEVEQAGGLV